MDLGAALWGPHSIGARRLNALVGSLPPDSATARALSDPEQAVWTVQTELMAVLCELVDANTRLHYDMNKKKGSRSPRPIRINRPWDRKTKRRATAKEARRLFEGPVISPAPKE